MISPLRDASAHIASRLGIGRRRSSGYAAYLTGNMSTIMIVNYFQLHVSGLCWCELSWCPNIPGGRRHSSLSTASRGDMLTRLSPRMAAFKVTGLVA